MDDLSKCLDQKKWQKLDGSQKTDFREFQVMRQHKQLDPTSYRYWVQPEGQEDPRGVVIEFTEKDKDPLKDIGTAKLLIQDDKVVAIDLDGDCFELIGK